MALHTKHSKKKQIVIIGAGPAGLACAWWLATHGGSQYKITVIEKSKTVGGLAKTLTYKGCRFDVGGHRFYTKIPEIETFYSSAIGNKMLTRNRLSRIYYDGKYFLYPLQVTDVLKKIGLSKAFWVLTSFIRRRMHPHATEVTFTDWVENRFGDALFSMFFRSYTEKVWGIKTEKLSANWAMQRIQNFSLPVAVMNAITAGKFGKATTVITQFKYPKFGPGQMYEEMQKQAEKKGVEFILSSEVTDITCKNHTVTRVVIKNHTKKTIPLNYLVSTMPFGELVTKLHPPKNLERLVSSLRFRHFLTVNLRVKGNPFPDNWIYIHDPSVTVGRIQNFGNWSPHMSNRKEISPVTLEYFCNDTDDLWNMKDEQILSLAKKEIAKIRLFDPSLIIDGFVYRVRDAYPVYAMNYEKPLEVAKRFIHQFPNVYTCGRGGMFRYNNMDHSLETGFMVARKIIHPTAVDDPWSMKEPSDYLEEK
jgi:protoporphyrinogen oxidase